MNDDDELKGHPPPLQPPLADTSKPRDNEPDNSEIEKIRKWQEERVAKKLRGNYESATLHLADLV